MAARYGHRRDKGVLCALKALALAVFLCVPIMASAQTERSTLPATLVADSVYIDGSGRLVAEGSVEIWQGSIRLTATRVIYDQTTGVLDITGPLRLSDGPDTLLLADSGQLSEDLRAGLLASAQIVMNQQIQITAATIERSDGRLTRADAVIASACSVCAARPTPLWEIRAARVSHDEDTRTLTFERAQVRVHGVPVAMLPRLRVPDGSIDRVHGLLAPDYAITSEFGLRVAVPYFIPFGDNRDLTLTPMMSSLGMRGLAFRWRQAFANGGIDVGGQVNIDRIRPGDLRGYLYARALFALRGGWQFTADAILPRDQTYLPQYRLTGTDRLTSHITLERIRRDQALRGRLQLLRSLRWNENNTRLPNRVAQVDWDQRLPALGGELTLAGRLRAHVRASQIDGIDGRDVGRLALMARWQRRTVLAGGLLGTVALQGRLDQVGVNDDSAFPDPISRAALEGMVELRWPLARVDGGGGQQLLEPVVQLIGATRRLAALPNDDNLMPDLDGGNLFSPLRYSGLDAPDDGSRVNAGLRWMRQAPGGWSIEALVGRIFRQSPLTGFAAGHVHALGQVRSDLLLAGRLSTAQGLTFSLRLLVDDNRSLSRSEAGLSFVAPTGTAITTRHIYMPAAPAEARPLSLNSWSVDLSHGFTSGWQGTFGWDFDITTREFDRTRGSLSFRNECVGVDVFLSRRFATSTNLAASTSFGLRVNMLGLTGGSAGPVGRTCRA
jgi:LPS-assembly protein